MKKLFPILTLCMVLCCVSCYDDSPILERLDALEKNAIASINEQISAIKSSITLLEAVDKELKATIQTLEAKDASQQGEIDKLREADASLETKIGELKTYVDEEISNTVDWATATFATLEQYDSLCVVLTGIETSISDLKEEFTKNLSDAISNSEESMKGWVNEQLTGYWTIAETQARLDTLKQTQTEEIEKLSTDLADAKEEMTEAYTTAISTAIEELDGKLSDEITKINDELTKRMDNIEDRLSTIEETLKNLTRDFSISFDDYDIGILAGGTASVGYTITGATEKTSVKALGQNGWSANVTSEGADKGKITVTAPNPMTDDEIIVLVYDGEYRTIMSSINFVTGVVTPSQTAYEFDSESGTIDVPISTNINYSISIPNSAKEWLSVVKTKSMRDEVVTFSYTANPGYMRSCSVDFIDEKGIIGTSISFIQKKAIVQADAVDLSAHGTANCYIISEEGWYKFNVGVKGNSSESVGNISGISLIWESFGTEVTPNVGDLIQEVKLVDDYAYVRTPNIFKEGNALVAVKDLDNNILWSWHLWLTDQPQAQVYNNDAGTMMDRNLGATSATPGDVGALGLLYQWGRKDPFLGSSSISSSTLAKSTITWPYAVESNSSNGTIEYATAHPTTFITSKTSNYDWYYTGDSSTDNTRWTTSETAKSIYDPCPAGWRVPDGGSNGIWSKAGFDNTTYDSTNQGISFSISSPSTKWYPASGYRYYNGGSLNGVGYYGYYGSASPSSNYAYGLYFNDSGRVYLSNGNGRAYGYSVRCLQESK